MAGVQIAGHTSRCTYVGGRLRKSLVNPSLAPPETVVSKLDPFTVKHSHNEAQGSGAKERIETTSLFDLSDNVVSCVCLFVCMKMLWVAKNNYCFYPACVRSGRHSSGCVCVCVCVPQMFH